jgi:cytochrome c biogenesis protein CcdA
VCLALLSLRYVYGTVISLLGLALFVGSSVSANELRRIKRRFMGLEL